jgi:hypothetical protein
LAPEYKTAGMPDYKYRSEDTKVTIQSITLQGNGINRKLQQLRGDDVTSYDWLISRNDVCYNTCFGFFGLPAGEYQLRISAEGYKSLEKNFSVTPGVPVYFRITELTPE